MSESRSNMRSTDCHRCNRDLAGAPRWRSHPAARNLVRWYGLAPESVTDEPRKARST